MVSRTVSRSGDLNAKAPSAEPTWAESVENQLGDVFRDLGDLNTRVTAMLNRMTYVEPVKDEASAPSATDLPLTQRVNNALELIRTEVQNLDRNVTSLEKIL